MPDVVISFHDGEILHAHAPDLGFDLAVLEAEPRSVDSNSVRGLFSVTAIRQILVGEPVPAPPAAELEGWDRAAFHFCDGQVLRAHISADSHLGRHGGVWRIVEQGSDQLLTMAIPYASLKGVFKIRRWDSRSPLERDENAQLEQLARVLAERHTSAGDGRRDPQGAALLSRMRRGGTGSAEV